MADPKELETGVDVASEGAPQGVAQEADGQAQSRQPETQPIVDLDSIPDFKKWKSGMDKKIANLQQDMTQAQRRAMQAEQALHQQRMQGMNEVERANYQVQMLQQQVQDMQRLRELDQYAFQKEQDIRRVAAKKGLDYQELVDALPEGATAMDLWEVADDLASNRQPAAVRPAAQANNQVDIGGSTSRPATDQDKLQAAYDAAVKEQSVRRMLEVKEEAYQKGVFLKEVGRRV